MKLSNLSIVAIALLLLAACTKEGSPTPGTGGTPPPGGGTPPPNKVIPTISNISLIDTYYHFDNDGDFSNVGTDVSFKANVTNAKSYDWDFGDNTEHSTDWTPTHTYVKSGIADTVKLKVTSSSGDTATMKIPVSVNVYNGVIIEKITAAAIFAPGLNYKIKFDITSTNNITLSACPSLIVADAPNSNVWTFASGNTSPALPLTLTGIDDANFKIDVQGGAEPAFMAPFSCKYIWKTYLTQGKEGLKANNTPTYFVLSNTFFNVTFNIKLNKI